MPIAEAVEAPSTAIAPVPLAYEDAQASLAALDDPMLGLVLEGLHDPPGGESLRIALAALDAALHDGNAAAAQSALEAIQASTAEYTRTADEHDRITLDVLHLTLARIEERLVGLAEAARPQP